MSKPLLLVKRLFTSSPEGLEYLTLIISAALKMPLELISVKLQLKHLDIGVNENVVNSETDIILENDEIFVNVEINTNNSPSLLRKNFSYICHLILRQTPKSKDFKTKLKKIYQININAFDIIENNEFLIISKILDVKSHKELRPYFTIIDINLEKLMNISYNDIKKKDHKSLEYLLYFLVCKNEDELDNVYNGDVFMEKIIDEAKKLTLNFDAALPYNREELLKQFYYELGEAQGIEQNIMQTAIKMLKENIDVNTITKITGLSKKQINDLKREL